MACSEPQTPAASVSRHDAVTEVMTEIWAALGTDERFDHAANTWSPLGYAYVEFEHAGWRMRLQIQSRKAEQT